MTNLAERAIRLEARLEDGWQRLESAPGKGADTEWEDFWLKLLDQYEQIIWELYGHEGERRT